MASQQPFSLQLERGFLLLLIFLLPLTTAHVVERPFAVSGVEILEVFYLVVAGWNRLRKVVEWKLPTDRKSLWVIGSLLVVLAYALLFTHPLRSGIGFWVGRVALPLLTALSTYQLLRAKHIKVDMIFYALYLSLIPQIIWGGLQLTHLLPFNDPGRVTAAYRWPDSFGRIVELLLLATLPWILRTARYRLIVWGLGALTMLASLSYGVVYSFVLALFCGLWLLPKRYRVAQVTATVLLMVGASTVALFSHKLLTWHYGIEASVIIRAQFWSIALSTIYDHLFTGIGLKGWELQYPHLVQQYGGHLGRILAGTSEQPQNFFLDSLLKAGIPGLLAITAFPLLLLYRGYQSARQGQWLGFSVFACAVSLLFFGLLDDPLWSDEVMPLLFILLACILRDEA